MNAAGAQREDKAKEGDPQVVPIARQAKPVTIPHVTSLFLARRGRSAYTISIPHPLSLTLSLSPRWHYLPADSSVRRDDIHGCHRS